MLPINVDVFFPSPLVSVRHRRRRIRRRGSRTFSQSANRDHGLLVRWLLRSVSPNSHYVCVLGEGLIVSPEECNIDFQCTIVYPRTVYVF